MRQYTANTNVPGGFYFNKSSWDVVTVSGENGKLPSAKDDAPFVRVPTLAFLVAAPVLGASMVIFLPFIGFALFARHAFTRLADKARASATTPAGHES